jgi:hypothetical protein
MLIQWNCDVTIMDCNKNFVIMRKGIGSIGRLMLHLWKIFIEYFSPRLHHNERFLTIQLTHPLSYPYLGESSHIPESE